MLLLGESQEDIRVLEEYRVFLTMRMLVYRLISLSLSAYSEEGVAELSATLSRLPRETPRVVSEALSLPSFAEYYELLSKTLSRDASEVVEMFRKSIERECKLHEYRVEVDSSGKRIAELAGMNVDEKSPVSLEALAELAYTILGIEYSVLDEYSILPLIAIESSFVLDKVVPGLVYASKCLSRSTIPLAVKLATLMEEYATLEKSISESEKRLVEKMARENNLKPSRVEER